MLQVLAYQTRRAGQPGRLDRADLGGGRRLADAMRAGFVAAFRAISLV